MNLTIQLKTTTPSLLVTLALVCFGLSPTAKALLPAPSPDGNYPGGNTAEGINALHDVNTAVGLNNTAVGADALTLNIADDNAAVGSAAMQANVDGTDDTAVGFQAMQFNVSGFTNVA